MTNPTPQTLLDVLSSAPGERTAIIVAESGARVSYHSLREQIQAMADALASAIASRWVSPMASAPSGCAR